MDGHGVSDFLCFWGAGRTSLSDFTFIIDMLAVPSTRVHLESVHCDPRGDDGAGDDDDDAHACPPTHGAAFFLKA